MKIIKTINEIRKQVSSAKSSGMRVGFVPTMGALHAGHLSLIQAAQKACDFVVVSIFVNPTQFGAGEDLDKYPRVLELDAAKCESLGVDVIFAPQVSEMYPEKFESWVDVDGEITQSLCGKSRPGHFRGVTTVCAKLFNIVLPDIAFFGQKDAQQLAVIKKMVSDLNMLLSIEACPIVREESGLAMSSRNDYLSDIQRADAAIIYQSLLSCEELFISGERCSNVLKSKITSMIATVDYARVDYIEIVDPGTLEPVEIVEDKALIAVAIEFGPARLIDNIILSLNNV